MKTMKEELNPTQPYRRSPIKNTKKNGVLVHWNVVYPTGGIDDHRRSSLLAGYF
jgi:hypothetical protein